MSEIYTKFDVTCGGTRVAFTWFETGVTVSTVKITNSICSYYETLMEYNGLDCTFTCCTKDEAITQHARAVYLIKNKLVKS